MRLSFLHITHIVLLAALLADRIKNSTVLAIYLAGLGSAALNHCTGWRIFALPQVIGISFAAWELHPLFAVALIVAYFAPSLPCPRFPLLKHIAWSGASNTGVWIFEGAIAAGKTTQTTALLHQGIKLFAEDVPPDLKDLFYNDMPRYGWALQATMCEQRIRLLYEAVHYESPHNVVVLDRGPFGCLALATTNYILGSLSDEEYAAYRKRWLKHEESFLAAQKVAGRPITIVYMQTPSAQCIVRLRERPGADSDVDKRYMRLVSVMHTVVLRWARWKYVGKLYLTVFDPLTHNANVPLSKWGRKTPRIDMTQAASSSSSANVTTPSTKSEVREGDENSKDDGDDDDDKLCALSPLGTAVQLSQEEARRLETTGLLRPRSNLYNEQRMILIDRSVY
jgi:deoxyadenosine/deoxycytidine kinase